MKINSQSKSIEDFQSKPNEHTRETHMSQKHINKFQFQVEERCMHDP